MMGIVKQSFEPILFFEGQHLVCNRRLVPFMDKDQIDILKLLFKKSVQRAVVLVKMDIQFWISAPEVVDGANRDLPLLANEVRQRPGSQLFVGTDVMTETDQGAE